MPEPQSFIVGRQAELEQFAEFVTGRTSYRVLNYYGPGGIGKTVLCQRMIAFCRQAGIPYSLIDGFRPDLTPDRILYAVKKGLVADEQLADAFNAFERQFQEYLIVQDVLQHGGGTQALFDVVGNIKDPAGFAQLLSSIGEPITEGVQRTVSNRFALERYLRGVEKTLTASLCDGVGAALEQTGKPVALLLDTYEEMEGLDDWVCHAFVPQLPEGVKIVVFGRNALPKVNFDWSELGESLSLHAMELPELPEEDARHYLAYHGLRDSATLGQVYRFTGGYPLLLVLVVHLAREAGGWGKIGALESEADRDRVATKLLDRILREERAREMREFLEKGSIARWFNAEIISVILEVNMDDARSIYDKLQRHSFVERHPYGLKFHDKIGELLVDRLKFTNNAEYQRLTKRLMAYYAEKAGIEAHDEVETGQAAINLLEILAFGPVDLASLAQDFSNLVGLPCLRHKASYRSDVYPVLLDVSNLWQGIKLPSNLPLLFIQDESFLQTPIGELKHYLGQLSNHNISVFVYMEELGFPTKMAMQLLIDSLQARAYDCIVLDKRGFGEIITAPDPQDVLRRLVYKQIDLTNISPFVEEGPTRDTMFFGREKELRKITDHMVTTSFALIGGRRIGKTSILTRLHNVRLPAEGYRTFYFQCQRLANSTPTRQEFFKSAAARWLPNLTEFAPRAFEDILAQLSSEQPLVFLIDEVDRLIPADEANDWPLFGEFRALAESGECRFIFAGERTLREAMKRGKSPLFNFTNTMLVRCLEYRAVAELATHPMKQLEIDLTDEQTIVQRIWDLTSGHPNVIQRLCQHLILRLNERQNRRLTPDDVEAVVADPAFQRDDFYDVYLEQATVLERIIPLILAQMSDAPHTLSNIHRLLNEKILLVGPKGKPPRIREVDAALRRLVDLRSVLDYTPRGYVFAIEAFPQVIARWGKVTMEDELLILTEKYRDYGDSTEDEIALSEA